MPETEILIQKEQEVQMAVKKFGKGRGVYICPDSECIAKARKKRALQRSFDTEISAEKIEEIFEEISGHE